MLRFTAGCSKGHTDRCDWGEIAKHAKGHTVRRAKGHTDRCDWGEIARHAKGHTVRCVREIAGFVSSFFDLPRPLSCRGFCCNDLLILVLRFTAGCSKGHTDRCDWGETARHAKGHTVRRVTEEIDGCFEGHTAKCFELVFQLIVNVWAFTLLFVNNGRDFCFFIFLGENEIFWCRPLVTQWTRGKLFSRGFLRSNIHWSLGWCGFLLCQLIATQ